MCQMRLLFYEVAGQLLKGKGGRERPTTMGQISKLEGGSYVSRNKN